MTSFHIPILPIWQEARISQGFPSDARGKEPACQCRRHKRCGFNPWVGKIPLEEDMATYSSILVWRTPWTEELVGYSSQGRGVGHD